MRPRFEPLPGTIIAGKYRVDRTLGEGGMGVVVAATHMALEQDVAIKFLVPEAMRSGVAVERFLREAKVAAKIRSEHVARVHDVGRVGADGKESPDDGMPYIVMERLEGSDLGQVIAERGALPIEEACEIVLQACEGLAQVHAAGIVHRDLKPSNIFVTRNADGSPAVKLLDFGISKLTFEEGTGQDPALTATATIMGSPSYMSPEQLKSTKEVDVRTDVWSLGAVLYEAVAGAPAFRGETLPQVCAMIASEDPALPSTRREGVPPELEQAILRCLDKDPATRGDLVGLARSLAAWVPERGRGALGRIEATAGASDSKRRDLSSAGILAAGKARGGLPVLSLATSLGRTLSAWGKDKRRRGAPVAMVLVVLLGVVLFGAYSERGRAKGLLLEELTGSASAPASPPPLTPAPTPATAQSPAHGASDDLDASEDAEDEPAPVASAAPASRPLQVKPAARPRTHPRPHHNMTKRRRWRHN
ncbi:MAG: serine/threonine-protein kinase [Polyangiaceae bacterium]